MEDPSVLMGCSGGHYTGLFFVMVVYRKRIIGCWEATCKRDFGRLFGNYENLLDLMIYLTSMLPNGIFYGTLF